MAKQDDGGRKKPNLDKAPSTKKKIDYSKAKLVKETPKVEEGWVEGKDPATGRKMWYRETGTIPGKTPGTPGTPPRKPNITKAPGLKPRNVLPKPGTLPTKPSVTPDTYNQEVVYMEDAKPEKKAVNLDVMGRTESRIVDESNPNFTVVHYPEAGTGGYANPTVVKVDKNTRRPLDEKTFDQYAKTGEYKPVFSSELTYDKYRPESSVSLSPGPEVNKSSVSEILSNTQNPVYRVGTKSESSIPGVINAPLINKENQGIGTGLQDVKALPSTELKDKGLSPYNEQYKKKPNNEDVIAPKFKDGGYVPKSNLLRKNYFNGGDVTPEEKVQGIYIQNGVKYRKDGTPIMTSGYDRNSVTPEITSSNTLPLTSGTEFKSTESSNSGSATYEGGTSTTDNVDKKQKSGKGQAVANKAGAALGAYGSGYWASKGSETKIGGVKNAAFGALGQMGPVGGAVSGISAIGTQIGEPIRAKSEQTNRGGELVDEKKARRNAIIGGQFDPLTALEARSQYKGGYTDISGKGYTAHIESEAKKKIADEKFAEDVNSRNARMNAAEGGTIVGKGGPKDDAILSKIGKNGIPSGSFIVPAENNGLAKKLREKFLGGNPEKKAQFKKGGEAESDVAVSNGEQLFTPKEKQKLTTYLGKEILEKLAPNAEENETDDMHENMTEDEHKEMMKMDMEHKANGGELTAMKARTMLHDKSANGKPLTDKQRRFFGWVAGGRKACGGMVKKAEGGNLKAPMVKYAKGTPPNGVKRVNSTGVESVDKMIDDFYANPPKTQKELEDKISKIKTLTRSGDAPKNAEVSKFLSIANPMVEKFKTESDSTYKANVDLKEKAPAILKNIKKLKEIGASDDIIKRYTEQAKKYDASNSTVKFSPDDLFDKYKTEVEDEDFKANKENVKKGLDAKVQSAYKELQDANNNPDKYTAEEVAKKQEVFDNAAMYRDHLNKGIDDNDIKAYQEGKDILSKKDKTKYIDSAKPTTTKTALKTPDVPVTKAEADEMARVKKQTAEAIKTGNVPTGIGPKKAPKVGVINKTGVTFTPKMTEDTGDFPVVPGTTETTLDTETIIDPRFKQKTPLNESDAKMLVDSGKTASDNYIAPKTEEKPKWYSGLGNGLEYGASAAQIGMGLRGLNKSGKMPVDKIDPLFQASVDKAQAAAKFGFTPEQQFAIDQDRQNAINAARFSARNFAGGNAGTAFTQERNAINQGWGMGLKAKIAGQELMQDKQRYADTLALQKAGMSRQLYEDKLAGWNQQQQAGSQLLGAGIRNLIGAGRYQKELEAQKQRQQYNG